MIYYLYHLEYPKYPGRATGMSELSFHIQMCVMADKYDIKPLQDMAVAEFVDVASDRWNTQEFAEAAAEAFGLSGPAKEICEEVVEVVIENRLLTSANSLDGQPSYRETFRQVAQGCPAMMLAMAEKLQEE
jgi:hypothetical protein